MSNVSTTTAAIYQAVLDSLNSSGECGVLPPAPPGKSAYEVAVDNGFVGSEQQWIDSLQHEQQQEIARLEARIVDNEKFTKDSKYAASRLVGTSNNNVPLSKDIQQLSRKLVTASSEKDPNNSTPGDLISTSTAEPNTPPYTFGDAYWYIETSGYANDNLIVQTAYNIRGDNNIYSRKKYGGTWTAWKSIGHTESTYRTTTATAPNVVVESNGVLKRSSSSEKYKDIISPLQLDDESYQKAMAANPIIYRSKADGDPKDWHFMSFLAEELGELDPSLTQWLIKTHDDEGNELDKPTKEAEGINLNAICAVLHATNIYQDKKLKELEQRLSALESSIAPEPVEE